ncbi:MAG: methionine--tRNA ligase [Chloroflexota bacterium]|nr:methionine--tRNA ligase [Chloroflexota bacterium]
MPERIFIGVAWPYANGPLHLGQIAGAYLPADIFARFHRLKGNDVLMVSGTDQHGTPITIRAEQEGLTPQEVVSKYHAQYLDVWAKLGISFDQYTTTGTNNHKKVVGDLFLSLLDKGMIYPATAEYAYCTNDQRFLPDRYVDGTCPHCNFDRARGDQCDHCGRTLDPQDLLNWRCHICAKPPEMRESEHFFLRLSALQGKLHDWAKAVGKDVWRPNVYGFTMNWLTEGLRDRAITRDVEWGVPVPLPGYETKRIYVWFEACTGYLSAALEWASTRGDGDEWLPFWKDNTTKSYYFIGKDNIPFHTIIWPAMLMAYSDSGAALGAGGLTLPTNIPANEFLSLEGQKFSTSQNWAVWAPDYLERYDPDPLRYYLSANMPEFGDSDFSWKEYYRRNNDELVATYGNLVHRVLTLTHRNFNGLVPEPGPFDDADEALMQKSNETLAGVASSLELPRFREAIGKAMALAADANRYVDMKAPWKTAKEDEIRTATTLATAMYSISALKTVLYPFIPHASERLHELLGFTNEVTSDGWTVSPPPAGQALLEPKALFAKLDEGLIEKETSLLEAQKTS